MTTEPGREQDDLVSGPTHVINGPTTAGATTAPTPTAIAAAPMVRMIIGGQTVEVSQDVADAYTREQTMISSQRREDDSRQESSSSEDDLDDLLFTNPAEYRKRIKEDIVNEVRSEYTQDQKERNFWAEFYRDYPELVGVEDIVKSVLDTNIHSIGNLPAHEGKKQLADLTNHRILAIAQRHGGNPNPNTTTQLEGGANTGNPTVPEQQRQNNEIDDGEGLPKSLSEAIKERQLNRMKAASAAGSRD